MMHSPALRGHPNPAPGDSATGAPLETRGIASDNCRVSDRVNKTIGSQAPLSEADAPTMQEAPGRTGGTREAFGGARTSVSHPSEYLAYFLARVLQDALDSASVEFWLRRAADFENARPRPGDFTGRATPGEIAERDQRCAEVAQNCRNHAEVLTSMHSEIISDVVFDVLAEVA